MDIFLRNLLFLSCFNVFLFIYVQKYYCKEQNILYYFKSLFSYIYLLYTTSCQVTISIFIGQFSISFLSFGVLSFFKLRIHFWLNMCLIFLKVITLVPIISQFSIKADGVKGIFVF